MFRRAEENKHFEEKHGRYKMTQTEFLRVKNTVSKEKTYRNYFRNSLATNMEVLSV